MQNICERIMQDWIIAISSGISAGATIALAWIAKVQLGGLKKQIKQAAEQDSRRNTLEACQRFEKDPIIKDARKMLWAVTNNGTDYTILTDEHKFNALTLLNYFQGLAIGIEQNVYIEQMVKDFLQEHLEKEVKALIKGESGKGWNATKNLCNAVDFDALCKLYDKWFPKKSPEYRAE